MQKFFCEMNLIVDIGNSFTKIAIFSKYQLLDFQIVDDIDKDKIVEIKTQFSGLKNVIFSSTKNFDTQIITSVFSTVYELNSQTSLPIKNLYKTPDSLGYDRIAASVGANFLFPKRNILIICLGTALTFNIIDEKAEFLGGNISLGLQLRFKALNYFTQKLPLISQEPLEKLYGETTKEAIILGVQNGITFEVEGTIKHFLTKFNNLKVILTGGDASFFSPQIDFPNIIEPYLTLIGLNRILEFQNEKFL